MRFRSAIDTWLIVVMIAAAVISFVAVFPLFVEGMWLLGLAMLVLCLGLPIWLLSSTWYELTDESLLVRSGPFSWKIARSEISKLRLSRSMLSSPALSLDRLEIQYGGSRKILVSPADRQGFIEALGLEVE